MTKIAIEITQGYVIFTILPQKIPANSSIESSINFYTNTGKSSSYCLMVGDKPQNLEHCQVDKLEVITFLKQQNREPDDYKFYIEHNLISTDYSSKLL
jgi:hypothetical protein